MVQRTDELIRRLCDARFDFVIIGGVAAVIHGSAYATYDFDVCAPFTEGNLARLLAALGDLPVWYAMRPDRLPLNRSPKDLAMHKNLYLQCDLGRLDLLSEVQPLGDYVPVANAAITVELHGRSCKVISLDDLISVKAHLNREKDRGVEKELRAIRALLPRPPE